MIGNLSIRRHMRHNRLRRKGVTVQGEKILRAAMLVATLRNSGARNHKVRLRTAKRICDLMESFIAIECERANSVSPSDPAHLNWASIGDALEISKSNAYYRYGKGKKSA